MCKSGLQWLKRHGFVRSGKGVCICLFVFRLCACVRSGNCVFASEYYGTTRHMRCIVSRRERERMNVHNRKGVMILMHKIQSIPPQISIMYWKISQKNDKIQWWIPKWRRECRNKNTEKSTATKCNGTGEKKEKRKTSTVNQKIATHTYTKCRVTAKRFQHSWKGKESQKQHKQASRQAAEGTRGPLALFLCRWKIQLPQFPISADQEKRLQEHF